jgi:uncharacterized protein YjbJ (UPF0337 family)
MAHKKRGGPEDALDKAMGGVGEAVGRVGSDKSLEAEGRVLRRKGELKTYLVKPHADGGGRSRPRKRPGPRASTGRRPRRWLLARNLRGARHRANCSSTCRTGSRYRRRKPTSSVYASSRASLLVFVPPRVGHRESVVQEREGTSGGEEQQGRQKRRGDG